MDQRGRKSVSEQVVAPVASIGGERPEPIDSLNDDEAAIWSRVVDAMPPNWFGAEHFDMLRQYCQHQARSLSFSDEVARCIEVGMNCEEQIRKIDTLTRMADRETKTALALARAMRLTQQAQRDPKTAGRDKRNNSKRTKAPWES